METRKYYYDLHVHTNQYSRCSNMDPVMMVDRAIEIGLDGVCITDHDQLWPEDRLEELRNYAGKKSARGLTILNGQEVRSAENCDHLVYGHSESLINGVYSVKDLENYLRGNKVPVIGAHPLRNDFSFGDMLYAVRFDALEAYNNMFSDEEEEVLNLIASLNLCTIGGSDAHNVRSLGRIVTETWQPLTSINDLVGVIFAGKCRAVENAYFPETSRSKGRSRPERK